MKQYTADETFRVLTQKPFEHVLKVAMKHLPNIDTFEEAEKFLLKLGWTVNEFEARMGVPPENRSYRSYKSHKSRKSYKLRR